MSTEEELECEFIKQYPDLYYEGGKNIFNFIRTHYIPRGEVAGTTVGTSKPDGHTDTMPQNIEEKMFIEAEVQLGTKKLRKLIKDIRTQTLREVLEKAPVFPRHHQYGLSDQAKGRCPYCLCSAEYDCDCKLNKERYYKIISDFKQIIQSLMKG